jgi:outer membrane biosynthesis protein TonB
MDEAIVLQIVDEFLSSLEPLDTQSAAVVQFLKVKGIASEEELAPFMEQAGNASSVRWLAARVRIKSMISSALKTEEPKPVEAHQESASTTESEPEKKEASPEKPKEMDDRDNQQGRGPEPKTKSSSAEEKETSNQEQEGPKKAEPKPAPAIEGKSGKDETKEGQAAPSKSSVKEHAA